MNLISNIFIIIIGLLEIGGVILILFNYVFIGIILLILPLVIITIIMFINGCMNDNISIEDENNKV
jgi:hypothetical protein